MHYSATTKDNKRNKKKRKEKAENPDLVVTQPTVVMAPPTAAVAQ